MPAPCRRCPRYTSCWLFPAPLLGDQPVFILVIWQRSCGTDESEAGRSCFATFSSPHCRGFPGPPLLLLSLLLVLWGPGPWDGGTILDGGTTPGTGEQSLQWGDAPWDRGVITGIRVVILEQIPGTGGSAIESSLPKVGHSRFPGSSQLSETSMSTH